MDGIRVRNMAIGRAGLYQFAFKMIENQNRHPGESRDPDAFNRLDSGFRRNDVDVC